MRLFGKVALVTGGSRGIGRAVCLAYAAEGAKVAFNYVSSREEAAEVERLIRAGGGEALSFRCDLADEQATLDMVRRINAEWGGVDILVNNAGLYPRKDWTDITSEEWDRVLAVNLKSCFLLAKAVYPHMRQKGKGKIINVSSVTFWSGQKHFLHYVSSKGGMIGFTRALAREVGEFGIHVNAITPGAVQTEQELKDFPGETEQREMADYFASVQCFVRRQVPSDVTGTFIFLASEDSDFITGQTINVDGGWMMH
ncbi:SDR family NAD(P)-dependent oxidoreductase [Paenibacillus sp. GCM10027626]|uniref:SDR family NAD(P)-dependent oxidoreductase n=1 Tax=Paenibacillus sp. GCM10027626 TaxID=3273411 RepID=UPI0036266389